MVFVCAVLFPVWKVLKKTKFVKAEELDLIWEGPVISAYEGSIEPPLGLWEDLGQYFGVRRKKTKEEPAERA